MFVRELGMTTSDAFALRRSGLDEFLCAMVGTEPNGMALSLMSVFARRGDDPWREAGRLVELSRSEAIDSLARSIAGMPKSVWTLPDATTIATRLVTFLPKRLGRTETRPSVHGAGRLVRIGILLAAIAFGIVYTLGLFTIGGAPKLDVSDISSFTSTGPLAPSATRDANGGVGR
jgi:hypothetical protein